jgi:hypothetical protein
MDSFSFVYDDHFQPGVVLLGIVQDDVPSFNISLRSRSYQRKTIRLGAVQIKPNRLSLDAGGQCEIMTGVVIYFLGMAHQFLP